MKESFPTRMENDLGRDDIRRLVRRIALPSLLATSANWRWLASADAAR